MTGLTPAHRLAPAPDVVTRELEGELVLLSLDRAEYFGLNATGMRVWRWLPDGPLGEIAARLAAEYGVAPTDAEADVMALARHLLDQRLVQIAPEAPA